MAKPHLCSLLKPILSLLLITSLIQSAMSGDDITCLKTVKASISDPNGYLSSWDFTNSTAGAICKYTGIDCWNEDENRVLNIRLSNMGPKGQFPSGIELCESLTGLDLSSNSFTGSIPENISQKVPYLTSIDLSFNSFSGEIPSDLSRCQYLNTVNLQHNELTSNIPEQLTRLTRLSTFNVANNQLTGPIPAFDNKFSSDTFANNLALCGYPLNIECKTTSKKRSNPILGVVIATTLGAVTGFWIGVALGFFVYSEDNVTPCFYYYILLRKYTLYLLSSCTREN